MYGKCTQKKCVVKRNMKIQIRGNERKNLLRLKRPAKEETVRDKNEN